MLRHTQIADRHITGKYRRIAALRIGRHNHDPAVIDRLRRLARRIDHKRGFIHRVRHTEQTTHIIQRITWHRKHIISKRQHICTQLKQRRGQP